MESLKKSIEKYLESLKLSEYYLVDGKFSKRLLNGRIVFSPKLKGDIVPFTGLPPYFLIEPKSYEIEMIATFDEAEECYEVLRDDWYTIDKLNLTD